jgi:two-component system, sensor histidine kinase and response regulator
MLTSSDLGNDLASCRRLGVSAYLIKPVRRAELRAAICSAIATQGPLADLSEAPKGDPAFTRKEQAFSLHILLAEDNAVNQRVFRRILEKAGHTVTLAENGKAALSRFEEHLFDLILMDVQMPEMDGLEATALLRKKEKGSGRHTPIIAMTAHAMPGDQQRCLEAGMDGYFTKPLAASALLDLVKKYGVKVAPRSSAW